MKNGRKRKIRERGRMVEGAEREGQEVLERQETKSAWWREEIEGESLLLHFRETWIFSCFEAQTSLIRYLKIPTYFDPFVPWM